MDKPENPPAFPLADHYSHDGIPLSEGSQGMTLRDWFAGQAVTGIIANSENAQSGADPTNCALSLRPHEFAEWIARASYLVADAMLTQREAGQ